MLMSMLTPGIKKEKTGSDFMSKMKDYFESDLNSSSSIFFNQDEFAEEHNINGVDGVVCIFDKQSAQALRPDFSRNEGIFKGTATLFIREIDLAKKPVYHQYIVVDKNRYTIEHSNLLNGLYEILLGAAT
jgi:hypothetical protein